MPKGDRAELVTEDPLVSLRASGPFQTVAMAAKAIRGSRGKTYQLAHEGRLVLVKLGGRTLVRTESLIAYIQSAEPWTPSDRAAKAVAARKERAQASRREFAA